MTPPSTSTSPIGMMTATCSRVYRCEYALKETKAAFFYTYNLCPLLKVFSLVTDLSIDVSLVMVGRHSRLSFDPV